MHIFLFPKNEGNNLTESAMPYYSDYIWFFYQSKPIRTFSPWVVRSQLAADNTPDGNNLKESAMPYNSDYV